MINELNGARVFVSGGAGVIGSVLVPMLEAAGAQVLVGDRKPRPNHFGTGVRYIQGDLTALTLPELQSFAPQAFIHLAATFERSTETIGFWGENFHNNLLLSHHLMTLAQQCPDLRRVVFTSSYLIYDPALYQFDSVQEQPFALNEAHPISPRNLTGMAKLAHEVELRFLAGFYDYPFTSVCARIFRGYGLNSRDVISRWVRALLRGEAISVYRAEGLFDYIYCKDSAEGLIRLMMAEQATGIANLGTGRSRRVQDVVNALRTHFPEAIIHHEDSDIPYEASQADTTRMRSLINWTPQYTLEEAIAEIVMFERARQAEVYEMLHRDVPVAVLVTSSGRKVPLVQAMKVAAKKVGSHVRVIAGDIDPMAVTKYVADTFWQMPRTDDASIDALLEGCKARGIRVILPTRDGELPFWARNRELFHGHGIEVIVSSPDTVSRCLDKLAFAEFGLAHGLPVIPASQKPTDMGSRLVVKERFGAGSDGIGLDLDLDAACVHAGRLDAPIFQPFVKGKEISIDAWVDDAGRPAGVVLRRRDRVLRGESQITTTFRNTAIEALAEKVLSALDLRGPVVMQGLIGPEGAVSVIEVNARFGGASTTAIHVGLDSLYWSLAQALGCLKGGTVFARSAGEVRQVRMPADMILHDTNF